MSEEELERIKIMEKINRVIKEGDAYFNIFSGCYDGYLTTDIIKDIEDIFRYCELLDREAIEELEKMACLARK